jgi:hypothetical protein
LIQLPYQIPVTPLGKSNVIGTGLLGLFLKTVEHVNRVFKLSNINYAEGSISLANPNLANAWADSIHRLPVIGFEPFLHLIKLVTWLSPCRGGKTAKVGERSTSELDWLGALAHDSSIQVFVYFARSLLVLGSLLAVDSLRVGDEGVHLGGVLAAGRGFDTRHYIHAPGAEGGYGFGDVFGSQTAGGYKFGSDGVLEKSF